MWTCPSCGQKFLHNNQYHSCGDRKLQDFLNGKSDHTTNLFWHFVECYRQIGKVTLHPAKTMIGIATSVRIAYVIRLGKNFVDVVFPFEKEYADNLCFHKIAQVPGTQQFNHHLRLLNPEDVNAEVKKFMKMAYQKGSKSKV